MTINLKFIIGHLFSEPYNIYISTLLLLFIVIFNNIENNLLLTVLFTKEIIQ